MLPRRPEAHRATHSARGYVNNQRYSQIINCSPLIIKRTNPRWFRSKTEIAQWFKIPKENCFKLCYSYNYYPQINLALCLTALLWKKENPKNVKDMNLIHYVTFNLFLVFSKPKAVSKLELTERSWEQFPVFRGSRCTRRSCNGKSGRMRILQNWIRRIPLRENIRRSAPQPFAL